MMVGMSRTYTGVKDGPSRRKRPGLELLAHGLQYITGGAVWVNGTYGIRNARSKSSLSVHATARAADLSRRAMGEGRNGCSRADMVALIDLLVTNADAIGLELLIDYEHKPHGRGWCCDRQEWRDYRAGQVAGGGSGDWVHIEISPSHADNPELIEQAWAVLFPTDAPAPVRKPASKPRKTAGNQQQVVDSAPDAEQ